MFRFLTTLTVVSLFLVGSGSAAFAGASATEWADNSGVGAQAGDTATQPSLANSGTDSSSAPVCTYQQLSGNDATAADQFSQSGVGPAKGAEPGSWYRQICVDAAGNSTGITMWLQTVDPVALAGDALDYSKLPIPAITMNPSAAEEQLVNLPVWLAIPASSWTPVSASASAGGVNVTTTATPTDVTWNMGDGDTRTCAGPGALYDPSKPASVQSSDCTYTFTRSSVDQPGDAFTVTATSHWRITWTATGLPAGVAATGTLNPIDRTASVAVRVGEFQVVNQE